MTLAAGGRAGDLSPLPWDGDRLLASLAPTSVETKPPAKYLCVRFYPYVSTFSPLCVTVFIPICRFNLTPMCLHLTPMCRRFHPYVFDTLAPMCLQFDPYCIIFDFRLCFPFGTYVFSFKKNFFLCVDFFTYSKVVCVDF